MLISNGQNIDEELTRLERELAFIKTRLDEMSQKKRPWTVPLKSMSFAITALVACASSADTSTQSLNHILQSVMRNGSAVALPPLDSMVTWARSDSPKNAAAYTSEVLSLIGEGSQQNSYLWPMYIELRGTTNSAATMQSSQSVGATVRSLVRSVGSPWTAGYHSEIAHGRLGLASGNVVPTNGTSILFNGEMRSYSAGGDTIGVNLQCVYTDSNSKNCKHALNIQAGSSTTAWQNGIHFESIGNYVTDSIGINFDQSRYNVGLDLGDNSLRLNAGQKILLTKDGTVYLRYNQSSDRVEIFRSGMRVASF
jgi:hypothetical protein